MSHPRALAEQEAIAAEQWFTDYERVGSFGAKCRELGVTPHTLRDAIRRVRGLDTKTMRRKLSQLEVETLADEIMSRAPADTLRVEPTQTGEQHIEEPSEA